MDLLDLFVKIGLDDKEYQQGMTKTEQTAYNVGASIGKALKSAGTVLAGSLATISAGIATATKVVGDAVVKGTNELASYGDHIDKTSQKMGMSAEAFQEWDAVMQHSGTSIESLRTSMRTLSSAAQQNSEAFRALGISQKQIASMSQEELFSATITALQKVEATTQRTYLASKLLGRGAVELGALLNTSAEETQKMKDRVHELGGVLSDEAVKASAKFKDNLQDMNTAIDGIKRSISSEFLPSLNLLMEGFTSLVIGEEGAEEKLSQGFDELVNGFERAVDRIEPLTQTLAPKIFDFISNSLPIIVDEVSPLIINTTAALIQVVAQAIIDNMPLIIDSAKKIVTEVWDNIDDGAKNVIKIVAGAWASIKAIGISADVLRFIATLNGKTGLMGGLQTISTFATQTAIPAIKGMSTAAKVATVEIGAAAVAIGAIIKVSQELNTIATSMNTVTANEEHFKSMSEGFRDTITDINEMPVSIEKYEKLGETLEEIKNARQEWAKTYQETNARIAELESKTFKTAEETAELKRLQNERDTLDAEYQSLILYQTKVENGLAEYSDELIAEIQREEKAEKAALDNKKAMYAGYYAEAERMAQISRENAGKTTSDVLGEQLDSHLGDVEHLLKTHKISEEEYWEQRKKWLEIYRNEESEDWWKYYDELTGHYDKLNDIEKKEQEKAIKEREEAAKKAEAERNQRIKDNLTKAFQGFEQAQYDNGYTEEWLVKQERAYIEALDHSSDLYAEYNLQITKQEKKIAEDLEKERKSNFDNMKKTFTSNIDEMIKNVKSKIQEYEKVVENIKNQISSFASSLSKSYKDMFTFDVDDETGKVTAKKTKNYITDAITELEQYYKNIEDLRSRGIGESMLNQLTSMSSTEGLAVTEYWKALSDKDLKSLDSKWDYYQQLTDKVSTSLYSDELQEAENKLDEERNSALKELLGEVTVGFSELKEAATERDDVTVNVNGIQYQNMSELVAAVATELAIKTGRKQAGYAV